MAAYLWVKNSVIHNIVEYPSTPPDEEDGYTLVPRTAEQVGDAFDLPAYINLRDRARAQERLNLSSSEGKVLRALVAVLLDEINILRQNASLPTRTLIQARNAIVNKLNSGTVDA